MTESKATDAIASDYCIHMEDRHCLTYPCHENIIFYKEHEKCFISYHDATSHFQDSPAYKVSGNHAQARACSRLSLLLE